MFKRKKNKKNRTFSPIYTIWILSLLIVFLSFVLSEAGFDSQRANIVNLNNPETPYGVEMTLETVNNAFSIEGLEFLLKNATSNLDILKPLVLLMLSLVGIGMGESSGFFKRIFSPLKKLKLNILIFGVLFISIISSFLGNYAYLLLMPMAGVVFKYANKNPVLGIMTAFSGITLGLGASLIFDYNDLLLSASTNIAANLQRNINFTLNISSNIFIKFASSILISILGTYAISKTLFKRYGKKFIVEEEIIEEKNNVLSLIIPGVLFLMLIYSIIPGLPFSGVFLDNTKTIYVDKLMSENSIFSQGFIYIFSIFMMLIGVSYGFLSGNFKDSHDYNMGLSKSFEKLGPLFVMLFFGLQMIALFEWTNIGVVLTTSMIELLGQTQITGLPLIIIFLAIVLFASILSPNLISNWILMAPTAVPMFMRSNITPEYTQFIYSAFSGVGHAVSPMFIYLLFAVGFIQKYEDDNVTIFGTIRKLIPVTLFVAGIWLLIILGWYIIGLPLGPSIFPTI